MGRYYPSWLRVFVQSLGEVDGARKNEWNDVAALRGVGVSYRPIPCLPGEVQISIKSATLYRELVKFRDQERIVPFQYSNVHITVMPETQEQQARQLAISRLLQKLGIFVPRPPPHCILYRKLDKY